MVCYACESLTPQGLTSNQPKDGVDLGVDYTSKEVQVSRPLEGMI